MTRHALVFASVLIVSACGGPTGPDSGSAQAIVENATPTLTINSATVPAGSTVTVSVGGMVSFRVDYRNNSGQTFHHGIVYVRDDGLERLASCGASGSGGDGGAFGSGFSIFPNDPMFVPGRTVRIVLLGALGPNISGPGQCYLQVTQGVPNYTNVQTQRLLVTLVVQ